MPACVRSLLLVLPVLLFASTSVGADVVVLKSGGRLEGVVTDHGDSIEVTSATGTVRLPRDKVDHIEKKEYVPPARPRDDQPPAAPAMGEHHRDPLLGAELQIPYGWLGNPPSQGSIFTFYGPSRLKYRPKMDLLATHSPGDPADIVAERKRGFETTFPGTVARDEPSFQAGDTTFSLFSADMSAEGLQLTTFQAVGAVADTRYVLSLTCETAERELVWAEGLKAFRTFRAVPPISTDDLQIHRFRTHMDEGAGAYKAGNTEGAIAAYKKAIAELPDHPMPWQNLGLIYASRNRTAEAIEAFNTVCLLNPDHIAPRFHLASIYRQLGKYEDARTHYEKVLTLDPRHPETYVNLAAIYQMKGESPLALRCARIACALAPEDVSAHFNLAQLLNLSQKPLEARREYERVLELNPNHKLAHDELERLKQE